MFLPQFVLTFVWLHSRQLPELSAPGIGGRTKSDKCFFHYYIIIWGMIAVKMRITSRQSMENVVRKAKVYHLLNAICMALL